MSAAIPLPTVPGPSAETCCPPSAGVDPALDADAIALAAAALAEPLRVQILDVLARSDTPVCQCELQALFEISQPLLSHHMKKLTETGLVITERRHRWAYYSVSTATVKEVNRWLSSVAAAGVAAA
jgi:ArsR family transcriptional regulator